MGIKTFPLGPTVTGLWIALGDMDVGEKPPAGVVDLEELLSVTENKRCGCKLLYHNIAVNNPQ